MFRGIETKKEQRLAKAWLGKLKRYAFVGIKGGGAYQSTRPQIEGS